MGCTSHHRNGEIHRDVFQRSKCALRPFRPCLERMPFTAALMSLRAPNLVVDTTQPDGSDGSDGSDAWPHRRGLLAANIMELEPDLLGMQELLPHMAAWLIKQLDQSYSFQGLPRDGPNGEDEMTAIFFRKSRFQMLPGSKSSAAVGHFWLSETPEKPGTFGPGALCTRMASWTRLRDLRTGGLLQNHRRISQRISQRTLAFSCCLQTQGNDCSSSTRT
eukprot:SAG31_NODE_3876_length_3792_cov_1.788248_3_plen_219_part_00